MIKVGLLRIEYTHTHTSQIFRFSSYFMFNCYFHLSIPHFSCGFSRDLVNFSPSMGFSA